MMKEINISNYEAYILDWIEGNLDSDTLSRFEQFLTEHPAIKDELAEFQIMELEVPKLAEYAGKNALRKDVPNVKVVSINRTKWYLVAASFLVLITAGWLLIFNKQNASLMPEVADVVPVEIEQNQEKIEVKIPKELAKEEPAIIEEKMNLAQTESKRDQKRVHKDTYEKMVHKMVNDIEPQTEKVAVFAHSPVSKIEEVLLEKETTLDHKNTDHLNQIRKEYAAINIEEIKVEQIQEVYKLPGRQLTLPQRTNYNVPQLSPISMEDMNRRGIALINDRSIEKYVGKLAFANTTVALVPSYLKQYLNNNN